MAVDMFMRVEGANGESKDSNHKEWTDIKSFAWGATQPGNMVSGGGGGVGKASFNDLQVLARIDKAAPSVLKNCASGKHLDSALLTCFEAGETPQKYLEITLTEGRNRQVRRMIEALGATVLKLVRVKIGSISIGSLPIGQWRMLTPAEIQSLRSTCR